ncbi:MAG: serine/threonine protein kinase [Ignavibacteriales bacterium]|nr:serine/threonine protein kinase [Ignavibacteriales bacterium]
MIGQTISHYKILEKLGEGGMGIVYKAHDTKLDRIIALKFLPAHISTDDEVKQRFIHEAQAASALNHTNICSIHTIEEYDGQQFIDMEFVEGKTRGVLLKEKELSLKEVVDIALQIAEGLNAAHKKGIVHRDIKPDNIMVTDEHLVKIMDFGLAKLKGSLKLTKTSSTVGTLAYMAPEQI